MGKYVSEWEKRTSLRSLGVGRGGRERTLCIRALISERKEDAWFLFRCKVKKGLERKEEQHIARVRVRVSGDAKGV